MYILAYEKDIQTPSIRNAFHEKMPDGRLILSGSEIKMAGSIAECQIVATARQLRDLIDKQKAEMPSSDSTETEEPIDDFFTNHNEETQTDGTETDTDTDGQETGTTDSTDGAQDEEQPETEEPSETEDSILI